MKYKNVLGAKLWLMLVLLLKSDFFPPAAPYFPLVC